MFRKKTLGKFGNNVRAKISLLWMPQNGYMNHGSVCVLSFDETTDICLNGFFTAHKRNVAISA